MTPRHRLPHPTSRSGAVLYAATGDLITTVVLAVLRHVHVVWR